jgi:hypothetical protein
MKNWGLLLVAGAVACGGGSTEPTANVSGTFTLQTINGSAPPVSIYSDPNESLTIKGGSLTLTSDRTYSLIEQEHVVIEDQIVDDVYSETGTFTQTGNNLELTAVNTGGPAFNHHMTWSGNQITWTDVFINTTSTYVFAR